MDGLGFLFKWNMGWMNDFLEYMQMDPYFRQNNQNMLTFSLSYAYAENYVLVISHDEVVHLKRSMIEKMPGREEDKFANLRTAYGFMYGHPGKKSLFMGQEFAQPREWSEARSLDWFVLDNPLNQGMERYVKALNKLYNTNDAMYANDTDPMGFEWTDCDHPDMSILSFVRRGSTPKKRCFSYATSLRLREIITVYRFRATRHTRRYSTQMMYSLAERADSTASRSRQWTRRMPELLTV